MSYDEHWLSLEVRMFVVDRRLVDAAAPDRDDDSLAKSFQLGLLECVRVVAVRRVVEPDDVLHRRHRGAGGGAGVGLADRPRAVLGLDGRDERGRDGGVVVVLDLVADAPDDDPGVVAVARHHVADVGRRPLAEEAGVVVLVLGLVPAVERLVHHQEAHPIGHVQQLRRGRVVGRAKRVDAHALEHLQVLLDRAVVDGGARAGPCRGGCTCR